MPRPRTELLRSLADYTLPIEPVLAELREYGWDAEAPLFTITRQHVIHILSRYLEDQLKQAVFELANPTLTEAVTPNVAQGLQKRLS